MALGDIVVKRVEGANVSYANLPPNVKLGVICRTRGKNVDKTTNINRGAGTVEYIDPLNTGFWFYPIREIGNITWNNNTYYINTHFALCYNSSPYSNVKNTLLDILPDNINNYAIKWFRVPIQITEITNSEVLTGGTLDPGDYYVAIIARGNHYNITHWVESPYGPTDYGNCCEPVKISVDNPNSALKVYWNPIEYSIEYMIMIKIPADIVWNPDDPTTLLSGVSPWLYRNDLHTNNTEIEISNIAGLTWKGITTHLKGPDSINVDVNPGTDTIRMVIEAYFENEQHSLPSVGTAGYIEILNIDSANINSVEWTAISGASGYYVYYTSSSDGVNWSNWRAIKVIGTNKMEPTSGTIDLSFGSGIGWDTGIAGTTNIFQPDGANYYRPSTDPYLGGGTRTLSFEPEACIVPGNDYTLNYKYADMASVQNAPKEYFTIEDVISDHGIGSEAHNIARLVLDPGFIGARSIVIVAPSSNTPSAYITALNSLNGIDVQLIAATMYDRTLFEAMYNHCENLSNPITGQQERYAIWSHLNNVSWSWIRNEFTNGIGGWAKLTASKGKRAFYVVVDGGYNQIAIWTNVDGTVSTNVNVYDGFGNDISPIIAAILTFGKYLTLPDIATPILEKNVPGVVFTKSGWPLTVLQMIEDLGTVVIQNRNTAPVVDSSTNIAYPEQPIEDSEMTIVITEDWIVKDLRIAFRQFRGQKFSTRIVNAATLRLLNKLSNYITMGIIQNFESGSVKVYQDALDPTLLRAFFKYTPVYPIKRVYCEFDYAIARIG